MYGASRFPARCRFFSLGAAMRKDAENSSRAPPLRVLKRLEPTLREPQTIGPLRARSRIGLSTGWRRSRSDVLMRQSDFAFSAAQPHQTLELRQRCRETGQDSAAASKKGIEKPHLDVGVGCQSVSSSSCPDV